MARFRPLNNKELAISSDYCVNFIDNQQVELNSTIENSKYKFSFDRIFNPKTAQQDVFDQSARPIIQSILEGFNGTILAYGQTSSGKTFTMQGDLDYPELEGIIPRTISLLFESIMDSAEEIEFTVKTSMVEIYMEKIRDLIDVSRSNLNIREDKTKGIYIEDISEYYVSCKEEIMELIKIGSDNRIQASTNMNENSSRSHSIFIITIHQLNLKDGSAKNSKLVLVDLAGSEKISKTGATGLTLDEAKTINKSLTTLGMVINSLTDGKSTHIPYRESKLTRVLQESLGGNSKTCLIVTCSPSIYNEAESLSTLRFGNRAKNIKNQPKINKELTVNELLLVIDGLEKKLAISLDRIKTLESYILYKGLEIPKDKGLYEKILRETMVELENKKIKNESNTEINKESNIMDDTTNTEMNKDYIENNIKDTNVNSLIKENSTNNIQYKVEKVDDYNIEKDDNYLINKVNKTAEKENNNFMIEKQIKEELALMDKDNNEESGLNKDQTYIINELKNIIKENEAFIYKLKDNEKQLRTNNDKLNEQIIEIKTKGVGYLSYLTNNNPNNQNYPNSNNNTSNTNNTVYNTSNNSNNNMNNKNLNSVISSFKEQNYCTSNKILSELLLFKKNEISNNRILSEIEDLKREIKKSENEKKFILKSLEEKSEKIAQQEIEIKEFHDMIKILEGNITPEDKNFAKKIIGLEKNLEQMNSMYQQIVTQKGVVKCENQILNKKIKQRNDRIMLLEKELAELKESVSSFILFYLIFTLLI